MTMYTIILYNSAWAKRVRYYEFTSCEEMITKFKNDKKFLSNVHDSYDKFRQLNGQRIIVNNDYDEDGFSMLIDKTTTVHYNEKNGTLYYTNDEYFDESSTITIKLPI